MGRGGTAEVDYIYRIAEALKTFECTDSFFSRKGVRASTVFEVTPTTFTGTP